MAAPTSFEGPFGKIVYRVRAVIDTPRFSKDYKAQKPFYLLNLLNLNQVPDIEVKTTSHQCLSTVSLSELVLLCSHFHENIHEMSRKYSQDVGKVIINDF